MTRVCGSIKLDSKATSIRATSKAAGRRARSTRAAPHRPLAPAFYLWPQVGGGAELCAFAYEDIALFFQRLGVVDGRAHVLHLLPALFKNFFVVVEDSHPI